MPSGRACMESGSGKDRVLTVTACKGRITSQEETVPSWEFLLGRDSWFLPWQCPQVLVLKSLNLEHCDILSYKLYLLLMRQYVPENDLHLQSTAYESSTVDRMMIHWRIVRWWMVRSLTVTRLTAIRLTVNLFWADRRLTVSLSLTVVYQLVVSSFHSPAGKDLTI